MKTKKIYQSDPWLEPFKGAIERRNERLRDEIAHIQGKRPSLSDGINNHLYYGLHKTAEGWVFREWAPNATRIYLIGQFNNWKKAEAWALSPIGNGNWEIKLPAMFLRHGELYKLFVEWPGGGAERIPAYATRVVQDPDTKVFSAQVWDVAPYEWKHRKAGKRPNPLIYECHIGMSSEKETVASFDDFRTQVLPRVHKLGYDVLQIMALQEHPYYGSFGYQVSNFFALSSRFGTPEQFKALVDEAHARGIAVIMDIVHSHAVSNEIEGLGRLDGREDLYFYPGDAGHHPAWGSRCFDYGKDAVKYFLLSNCKYWMEEYHLDGFRFDGVTSMLYWDHGLGTDFGNYDIYFGQGVDENAVAYLGLANTLIHEIDPDAITIAEDVSGMPGLAAPIKAGGVGFDFRMAMGIADHWIKWIKEKSDEQWSPGEIWYELTNKRADEKTVSYAECHDQALVGDKTIIFRLIDKEMYFSMDKGKQNLTVERGVALHKMIRLVTAATAGDGYLNFMGNEFGHPEWIDFPREGNNWSYSHARRLWSIADDDKLLYKGLELFDRDMVQFIRKNRLLSDKPVLLTADEQKGILVFLRKNCIFALNFNPTSSFGDYGFSAPEGKYELVFSTDDALYNGQGRLSAAETHFSMDAKCPNGNQEFDHTLYLYLPSRCAVVLKKTK
ncbi:MAG: alpha amylase C-terminal domain-containing protein [Bacteroidales bacterium]|nr:alpha amylase C-terminal domain-containing protein [Bacteroidales bacterium]